MTIGTSLGHHFQDEHHYQAREFQSDIQRDVNKQVESTTMDVDPDLIRDPLETSTADTSGLDMMGIKEMQMLKSTGEDPGNIYNDSGYIVDYKPDGQWGTPDLPVTKPTFNEIDALADRKTDEQIRKEAEELNALH